MASIGGLRLLPPVGVIVTVIFVVTLSSAGSRAATRSYGITDLGTLGGTMTFAYDLNDAEEV